MLYEVYDKNNLYQEEINKLQDNYLENGTMSSEEIKRYWQYRLFSLIDVDKIKELYENGINEDVLLNELGITLDEFNNIERNVFYKAYNYLSEKQEKLIKH